jgi:hypothetical protein
VVGHRRVRRPVRLLTSNRTVPTWSIGHDEHRGVVVTFDRDFGRFDGLAWQLPD